MSGPLIAVAVLDVLGVGFFLLGIVSERFRHAVAKWGTKGDT